MIIFLFFKSKIAIVAFFFNVITFQELDLYRCILISELSARFIVILGTIGFVFFGLG